MIQVQTIRQFIPYLSAVDIERAVKRVAVDINRDYKGKHPLVYCHPEWVFYVRSGPF